MRFENLTFTTFLSPFINTVTFCTRCEYYLWLDSKYNVRRCDVLVQNKTIHSLNLSHLIEYFFKNGNLSIGNLPCDTRGA